MSARVRVTRSERVIDIFKKANQIEVPFQVVVRLDGDEACCYADNKKITQELGWKSRRDLIQMCWDA